MSELFLGLDIGTGSSKGVLSTADGRIVATATRSHQISMPRPGWAEMDAATQWSDELDEITRELVGQVDSSRITGVCVSGLGPCLLLCDAALEAVRPAILYGIDMRAPQEISELTARYGAEQIVARGGTALSTQAVGPKMEWVRRNEPDAWGAAQRWYNSSSYVVARLTGEYVLDHHTASQCDPLYDMRRRNWYQPWVDDLAGHLEMPRLAWPAEVVGSVTPEASARSGIPAGTPVTAGTVDAWAEAFSAGVRRPGDLMLMYGSTMFFVQAVPDLRTHPMLWATAGVEPQSYTVAAGMATSGSLTTWLRELCGDAPFPDLVAEATTVPPGADGLLVLPYFAGERTPIFDPRARGVIAGLTLRHRRGHLFRAAYEGIACGVAQILDLFDAAGGSAERLVAVGGGTQGGLWTQIVSDVTGQQQIVPAETIGASYGDALMAAIGTGAVPPETDWTRHSTVIEPNPAHRERYDELRRAYAELYPATKDIVHRLAGAGGA